MLYVFVSVGIFILDQLSKYLAQRFLPLGCSNPIIPDVIHFTLTRNTGGAFGILGGRTGFFVVIAVLAIVFLTYYLYKSRYPLLKVGLALQIGGAAGNLVDRIRLGYVVDFVDLLIWPVFNIADTAIVTGVILFGYALLRDSRQGSFQAEKP